MVGITPFVCWGYFFQKADAVHMGVVYLSRMAAALGVRTQHQYPSEYSLSSLPNACIPSFSLHISSLLSPPPPTPALLEPWVNGWK